MKPTTEMQKEMLTQVAVDISSSTLALSSQVSYHELDEVPVREVDLVEQLENNLQNLATMQSRLTFLMREVRYLMKF